MNRNSILLLIATLGVCAGACAGDVAQQPASQVTVELTDGSSLVGKPLDKSLQIKLDYGEVNVPFDQIKSFEVQQKGEHVIVHLKNGDKITGTPRTGQIKLDTLLGRLSPEFAQIERLTFSTGEPKQSAAGKGGISFDGLNWQPWRTSFKVEGDKVVTLPRPRPGFNYGHTGSGRGPMFMSNVGNPDWKDYRIEFEYCVTGVDPSFNTYGLPPDYHDGVIFFHVADAKESWNERGFSAYMLDVQGDGHWSLKCQYNSYCRTLCGFGNYGNDGERILASGDGLKIDRENGNKFRIEIRGQNIKISVDGEQIADVTDEQMGEAIGGQTLDHGGVGFHWGMDCMGWMRNFSFQTL